MTAVVLYFAMPGIGHHDSARLELEAVARGPSHAQPFACGRSPPAETAGHVGQSTSLQPGICGLSAD
jgi:hypothetical protein